MEGQQGMCLERDARMTEEAWRGMPLFAPTPLLPLFSPFLLSPSVGMARGWANYEWQWQACHSSHEAQQMEVCVFVCVYMWLKCHWGRGYTESLGSTTLGRAPPHCPLFPAQQCRCWGVFVCVLSAGRQSQQTNINSQHSHCLFHYFCSSGGKWTD